MDSRKTSFYSWFMIVGILCLAILLNITLYQKNQQARKIGALEYQIALSKISAAEEKTADSPERYGMIIGVKPEKLEFYKKLHADTWPGVNRLIRDANIQNYSIYLTQLDDGKWYLFAYFEYTGNDFEADMKKMGKDEEMVRWWKETDPCQIPLENRKEGEWWKKMEEVYRLK